MHGSGSASSAVIWLVLCCFLCQGFFVGFCAVAVLAFATESFLFFDFFCFGSTSAAASFFCFVFIFLSLAAVRAIPVKTYSTLMTQLVYSLTQCTYRDDYSIYIQVQFTITYTSMHCPHHGDYSFTVYCHIQSNALSSSR